MAVPRPNVIWRGAHPNNFTVNRPGAGRDGRNSFHHVVGSAESAVVVFNNPNRGASSHFVITDQPGVIYQCVDINNTAWCDGNWQSNLRTISMEHHGDWRNGYNNPQVLENSAQLVAWLRENYGVNRPVRHRDVVDRTQYPGGTACPADLPVEAIWNRSDEIIRQWNAPPPDTRPEWLKNRSEIPGRMVYGQKAGIFVRNLNSPADPLDSRRFALNQNFEIKGQTSVGGKEYWLTKSSFDLTIASGLAKDDVAETPFVPPTPQPIPEPPKPTTPAWADSLLVDDANREMYVLRATPLIDLENGHPFVDKNGKEVWYQAGDIVKDVSAHTIVSEHTYYLTEYSLQQIQGKRYAVANGIYANDLTIDAKATPAGTPANPAPAPEPTDPIEPMPDVPTESTVPPAIDISTDGAVSPRPPQSTQPNTPDAGIFIKLLLAIFKPLLKKLANRQVNK